MTAALIPACVVDGKPATESPAPSAAPQTTTDPAGQPGGAPTATDTAPPATSGGNEGTGNEPAAPVDPATGARLGRTVIMNPPPPSQRPAAPAGKGRWVEANDRQSYHYDDGGILWVDPAGSCTYAAKPAPCPPGVACNPPPPRAVQCPADVPKPKR
jgi:hypothetical protein